MNETEDISAFLEDPEKLVSLCQDVVNELTTSAGLEDGYQESRQLLEISKTIERLEKDGIGVPEALRSEKSRLSSAVDESEETVKKLELLKAGLQAVCSEINTNGAGPKRSDGKRLTRGQLDTIAKAIVQNLEESGGSKHCNQLIRELSKSLRSTEVGPIIFDESGDISSKFRNACYFRAHRMRKSGIFKESEQPGMWELNKGHKE